MKLPVALSTKPIFRLSLSAVAIAAALTACGSSDDDTTTTPEQKVTSLSGVVAKGAALANASITVCDVTGSKKTTKADAQGAFKLEVADLRAPLLIAASNGTVQMAALLPTLQAAQVNISNVNPLTDKISSDVAVTDLALKGSVQLIAACNPAGVRPTTIQTATANLRTNISKALTAAGLNATTFDPVTVAMKADHTGTDAVLDSIQFNREGYSETANVEMGVTHLYDRNMQEITSSNPLDPALAAWSSYKTRIFIAGDSTSSNYPTEVAPRMGWGQIFGGLLKTGANAKVVNMAQSGRSSRSFITEGWLQAIADNIQAGDILLVQFGHNDEKCDNGTATDVTNRCTYPNTAGGVTQYPANQPDYSFQKSLEKYVQLAKSKGAIPVLITPTTRIPTATKYSATAGTTVTGKFSITASTHITSKSTYSYVGNYSQTVIDTAKANDVAVIDLDTKTIAFMNAQGEPGWKNYHLSVSDFTKYPFYSDPNTVGNYQNTDPTHYQQTGAEKVASLVVEGIKADPTRLQSLINLLN